MRAPLIHLAVTVVPEGNGGIIPKFEYVNVAPEGVVITCWQVAAMVMLTFLNTSQEDVIEWWR